MLTSIQISHYVLIDSLTMDFNRGFAVLTGETGAGKSIILGALNLLMGQRAESRVISEGADKCVIEGHFDITGYNLQHVFSDNGLDYDETDTIFRREVSNNGKSRAFINDTPVALAQLREIGGLLIDIHSQHQNLLLGNESFQFSVVDTIAGNTAVLSEYREVFSQYKECIRHLEAIEKEAVAGKREQDFLQFQFEELDKAGLQEGELESLEEEQDILSHAEEIKESLYQAESALDNDSGGVLQQLRVSLQALRNASRNMPSTEALAERMESVIIELRDIYSEISVTGESVSFDPKRLDMISERLDLLYTLMKKHDCDSVEALIHKCEDISERLARIESSDDEILEYRKKAEQLHTKAIELASNLSVSRTSAATEIGKKVPQLLSPLGIPEARFSVSISRKEELDENGYDSVRFMFSANAGTSMQELSSIASGGELSRVMLVIKSLLAGVRNLPTIVFDEIDTGLSGAVAEKMALMMREMSAGGRQVIAISHLPQIAAKSDSHYLVYKKESANATHTYITELDIEDRVTEIARMMSGSTITAAAMDNARALMKS